MFNIITNLIVILFALYSLGMSIFSGYTADTNKPDSDSKGLFIASYVICIIYCVIYLGVFIHMLFCLITNNYKKDNEKSDEFSLFSIPALLNIYWVVIYFNYKISDKYDEFALVKTIEFFTLLSLLILFIVCIFPFIVVYTGKTTKNIKTIKENNKDNTSNAINDSKNITSV